MKWLATLTLLWLALLPLQAQAGSATPCHEPSSSQSSDQRMAAAPGTAAIQIPKSCPHHGGARCHCLQTCSAGGAAALLIELPALAFRPDSAAPRPLRASARPRSSAAPPLRPPILTL